MDRAKNGIEPDNVTVEVVVALDFKRVETGEVELLFCDCVGIDFLDGSDVGWGGWVR